MKKMIHIVMFVTCTSWSLLSLSASSSSMSGSTSVPRSGLSRATTPPRRVVTEETKRMHVAIAEELLQAGRRAGLPQDTVQELWQKANAARAQIGEAPLRPIRLL